MINKKRADFMLSKTGSMVLIVVGILVVIAITNTPLKAGQDTISAATFNIQLKACEQKFKDIHGNLRSNFDDDQYPDCCDPCPLIPNNMPAKYPDNDGDGFPSALEGNTQGCLGNNAKIPYKTDQGNLRTIDVAKYLSEMEKTGKIETQDNDNPENSGQDTQPVYDIKEILKVCK